MRVAYFNGKFVPEAEARISIYDSALTYGDMAYEVTRTIRGRPFRLQEHLQRLQQTLAALATDAGLDLLAWQSVTEETLARNLSTEEADVDWQIMHHVSRGPIDMYRTALPRAERGPTVLITCFPLTEKMGRLAAAYQTGLDLVVPPQRSLPDELLPAWLKTRSRLHFQLANLQAEAILPGASALLLDPAGRLTEGTTGNLFLVRQERLLTPARGILLGVTRGLVLELATKLGIECQQADLILDDARAADELFLTSTSIGILHARSLDGQTVATGRIGPVTKRLRAALHAELGLDFAAQARLYADRLES